MVHPLLVARTQALEIALLPALANRHGCITGATGTGKTVSLQVLAEQFSNIGVPVFMADVKGDLSGMAKAGTLSEKLKARLEAMGAEAPSFAACPVTFWDVYGAHDGAASATAPASVVAAQGHPVRATISDMGPLLLARMLNLNDTQEGVLRLAFKIADDHQLLLLDAKDLRAMLQYLGDNAAQFQTEYGNISAASIGAIQRGLMAMDEQGGDVFFGEPMLNTDDLLQTDSQGRGIINILAADKLLNAPRLYSTFLLWLLSDLYEHLPEVGDLEKPKLVFFFDEAHLLFNEAPKPLLEKIEQVVRLIRSKGVGVYFVTQNPLDIPDTVLGQLGNRIQHALRAFTPRDQKAVKAAAETMRANPEFVVEEVISELAVGEALVSFLDEKGRPNITQRVFIIPPASQIGAINADERAAVMRNSIVAGVYEKTLDRESAYEILKGKSANNSAANSIATSPAYSADQKSQTSDTNINSANTMQNQTTENKPSLLEQGTGLLGTLFGTPARTSKGALAKDTMIEAMAKSAARAVGSQVGRQIVRGVLGSLFRK